MDTDPLLIAVTFLLGHARQRTRAALDNDVGAISLEWIVIAGILVAAATAAGVFFVAKLKYWEGKVP